MDQSVKRPESVLHIVPALFGDNGIVGGAERYALEMARHMADVVPTTLLSFGAKDEEYQMDRLRVRILGDPHYVRGQRTNPISSKMPGELWKAAVVHCHQQHVLASSLSAMFCRMTAKKVFVSNLGGGGWDISHYLPTEGWYHGHLHISEYSRTHFGHAQRRDAHVIYGGVDTVKFCPAAEYNAKGPAVFTGRLMPHKGVDILVQAAGDPIPVDLIGRPYNEKYQGVLKELAQNKPVRFLTGYGDDELVAAYQKALCVVLPSVYKDYYGDVSSVPELLGQTLLEGMACGVPVICSDVASMPEVVVDGVTGFIVPPNDSKTMRERLLWLSENPERAAEMGRAGRQRVLDKFNWRSVVDHCLELYAAAR